jgi:hypothetical protein
MSITIEPAESITSKPTVGHPPPLKRPTDHSSRLSLCGGHAVYDIGSEPSSLPSPSFLNADLSFASTFFKPLVHCLSTLIFPAANLRRLPAMLRTFVTAFLLVPQNIFQKNWDKPQFFQVYDENYFA